MPEDPHPLAILAAATILWVLETSANAALFAWMMLEAARNYVGGQ